MLTKEIEDLARSNGVNMAVETNIVTSLNDIRILLETLVVINANKDESQTKTSPELQTYLKSVIDANKLKYADMSNEEYFNFLYGEISKAEPKKVMAMREHISEVSETIKNTVINGGASIKGTLSEGVDTIITDTEKEIAESLKQDVSVSDDELKNVLAENFGEPEVKEEEVKS